MSTKGFLKKIADIVLCKCRKNGVKIKSLQGFIDIAWFKVNLETIRQAIRVVKENRRNFSGII